MTAPSYTFSGVLHLSWLAAAPAVEGQPTAAEANAGVDFRGWTIEADFPIAGSTVSDGTVLNKYEGTVGGNIGGQPVNIEFRLGKAASNPDGGLAWTTFLPPTTATPTGTTGYWVISRFGLATPGTFAIGDIVETWPAEVVSRNTIPMGFEGGRARFTVQFAVPTPGPTQDFAITA